MKKIILAGMLAAISITSFATTAATSTTTVVAATEDDTKTKTDPATLPDAVKKTLADDTYKDWKVTNAWTVKADPAYYTVELTKDGKTTTVNISADGKVK